MTTTFEIQRRSVRVPVRARDADSWSAQFLVRASAAQALVAPAGLHVAPVIRGRALLSMAFARYRDTDVGAYDELAVALLVARGGAGRRRGFGLYVHRLPTSETFVVEAGREGGPLRPRDPNLPNYTLGDGVLRRSAWEQDGVARARLGGGRLILGSHPMADELRSLGLPRRALMCGTMRGIRATFGPPVDVSRERVR